MIGSGTIHGSCESHGEHHTNVGESERWASMIGGGALAAFGLMRGSLTGLAAAALGGILFYRGYTGHCDVYKSLGYNTADGSSGEHSNSSSGHEMQRAFKRS